MKKLLEILNSLIEKYQIEEADVREIQTALAEIESDAEDEFKYEEEEEVQAYLLRRCELSTVTCKTLKFFKRTARFADWSII